jgi:6-phosphogluconolactonase
MLKKIDERRDLAVLENMEACIAFCVDHVLSCYQKAIQDHGAFFVALSGGSTPKAIFERMTASPISEQINWSKVHLFWGDERPVPPDHSESNFHMAMKAGFERMGIPPSQIHRMVAETDIEQNAEAYESILKKTLPNGQFDLVMLGMGEDGHTASLFPGTAGLTAQGRLVIANYVPQKNTWRMTLSFDCINKAKNIAIYVLGRLKKEMLEIILEKKPSIYPIEQIGTPEHKALWIADQEAAAFLD